MPAGRPSTERLIVAARALGATQVTHNPIEFSRVDGLRYGNWAASAA